MPELQPTAEYHYMVGHIEHSAMLTPKMAERLGAKPIGEPLDKPATGEVENNEAQRSSTLNRDADDSGTSNPEHDEAAAKAKVARNKRATGV
jgi:hypothetical protein